MEILNSFSIMPFVNLEDWFKTVKSGKFYRLLWYNLLRMDEREGLNEVYPELTAGDKLEPETLTMKLRAIGYEKDRILGALHNRVANWGAGFLDYHFGIVWGGFGRFAERQRTKARTHFRDYLEKTSDD